MNSIIQTIKKQHKNNIEDLIHFLKIPSVSAQKKHQSDCQAAAEFLMDHLKAMGLDATLHKTPGNPVITAKYHCGDQAPTILIYGHYDVQPAEPFELWKSPPFEPQIRKKNLYARGATDDKGQLMTHIKAVEAHLETNGHLPVNVIFLIEGEEEIASNTLENFINENRELLKSDIALISDSSQFGPDMPAICYGLRGICVEEIRVEGPGQDLHSGSFGGAVPNPLNELCTIVSKLKDDKGTILIPGFYDDVLPLEDWEREAFNQLPWDDESFCCELKLTGLSGENGFTTLERKWARPTLDLNGIYGGYQGEGAKTIIPAWGGAKISMRLVPDQSPQKISRLFREYINEIAPSYIRFHFAPTSGCGPVRFPRSAKFMQEAEKAIETGFGVKPVYIREGGSIPIVLTLKEELGLHTLLLGWGQPDDNPHSPNEKFSLKDFERGTISSACFLQLCGENPS